MFSRVVKLYYSKCPTTIKNNNLGDMQRNKKVQPIHRGKKAVIKNYLWEF